MSAPIHPATPRIIDTSSDQSQPPKGKAPKPVEVFLMGVETLAALGVDIETHYADWVSARQHTHSISQLVILVIDGQPHYFSTATLPDFINAQWGVNLAIQVEQERARQEAARGLERGVQPASAQAVPPIRDLHRRR